MPRVVVHLRRRDLLHAQFQMIRRMRVFKILFVASLAAAGWRSYQVASGFDALGVMAALLTAVLFTVAALVVTYAIVAPLMLLRLRTTPGVLGEHVFELTPEGLRDVTELSEIRVSWGSARRVFRTRSFLFALVRERGAFLFPRRAFADSGAYDDFWNGLQPLVAKKIS
jgi:hypothetical protein